MKKVFWTFIITILLLLIAAGIGWYWYFQKNPTKIQEFIGCNSAEQSEFNANLATAINQIISQSNNNTQQLQTLTNQLQQIIDTDTTSTRISPVQSPLPEITQPEAALLQSLPINQEEISNSEATEWEEIQE